MSRTFTKLFSSITESTVWCEPHATRIVWITMLAMADHAGRVWAAVPGLANRARVSIPEAEEALRTFLSPDPYSRTPEHEGRRIEAIDGGWRLLNHDKYRSVRDDESIRESKRRWAQEHRAKQKAGVDQNVEASRTESNGVDRGRANAEAEAEADTKKDQDQNPCRAPRSGVTYAAEFEEAWSAYPSRPGASKKDAHKAWLARVKAGANPAVILEGVKRYAMYCLASGTEPQYIKQPATFFGPGEHYLSEWTPGKSGKPGKINRHSGYDAKDYRNGANPDGNI